MTVMRGLILQKLHARPVGIRNRMACPMPRRRRRRHHSPLRPDRPFVRAPRWLPRPRLLPPPPPAPYRFRPSRQNAPPPPPPPPAAPRTTNRPCGEVHGQRKTPDSTTRPCSILCIRSLPPDQRPVSTGRPLPFQRLAASLRSHSDSSIPTPRPSVVAKVCAIRCAYSALSSPCHIYRIPQASVNSKPPSGSRLVPTTARLSPVGLNWRRIQPDGSNPMPRRVKSSSTFATICSPIFSSLNSPNFRRRDQGQENEGRLLVLGQPHIKLLSHQYLTAIVIIEPSPNALLPDTDFRILALEKIHRHMPNHSEIMWCISRDESGSRLLETSCPVSNAIHSLSPNGNAPLGETAPCHQAK